MKLTTIVTGRRKAALAATSLLAAVALLAACASTAGSSKSDSGYPKKAITLTIPYAPGGGTDTAGRLIAKALESELGKSVVVVNKEGGGGAIGVGDVAKAKADGYTIGIATDSNIVLQPILNKDLPYTKDDLKVWGLAPSTFVLVAAAKSKYTSLTDIIAEAKKHPGKIRVAHPGTGGSNDLTAQAFAIAAGVDVVPVPITGGGAEINKAVASGQVELAMTTVPVAKGFVDAGKLVVAGTMGDEPAPGAEKAETLGSIGVDTSILPKAQLVLVAPSGVDDSVVDTLTSALRKQFDGDLGQQMSKIGFPAAFTTVDQGEKDLDTVQAQYEQILEKFADRK